MKNTKKSDFASLAVNENSALAWHPKDAEKVDANSRCIAMDSHLDISKKDAETPEENPISFDDQMNMKANNCQPGFTDKSRGVDHVKRHLKEFKYYGKAMQSQPDILKKNAERLEAAMNSHLDSLKKSAAEVEARSMRVEDLKKKFENMKKAMNFQPDNLKIEKMLDFFQKQSEKLTSFAEVPISTDSEESDDEYVAPPLTPNRHALILEYVKSRSKPRSHFQEEAVRIMGPVDASEKVKKAAKDVLEFIQFSGVFGDLMTAQ